MVPFSPLPLPTEPRKGPAFLLGAGRPFFPPPSLRQEETLTVPSFPLFSPFFRRLRLGPRPLLQLLASLPSPQKKTFFFSSEGITVHSSMKQVALFFPFAWAAITFSLSPPFSPPLDSPGPSPAQSFGKRPPPFAKGTYRLYPLPPP